MNQLTVQIAVSVIYSQGAAVQSQVGDLKDLSFACSQVSMDPASSDESPCKSYLDTQQNQQSIAHPQHLQETFQNCL